MEVEGVSQDERNPEAKRQIAARREAEIIPLRSGEARDLLSPQERERMRAKAERLERILSAGGAEES